MSKKASVSLSRRAFLGRLAGGKAPPIRPPWTREENVRELCTSCAECEKACPEKIIFMDGDGMPELTFEAAGCVLCGRCAEACPESGLFDRTLAPPIPAVAHVDENCLNAQGVFCLSCRDACDYEAVLSPAIPNAPARISAEDCVGCGLCLPVCPAGAIRTVFA